MNVINIGDIDLDGYEGELVYTLVLAHTCLLYCTVELL